MASLRKLFRSRGSIASDHNVDYGCRTHGSTSTPSSSIGKSSPPAPAIRDGLVSIKTVGRAASWKWAWLELREGLDGSPTVSLFEPGRKVRSIRKYCCLVSFISYLKGLTRT